MFLLDFLKFLKYLLKKLKEISNKYLLVTDSGKCVMNKCQHEHCHNNCHYLACGKIITLKTTYIRWIKSLKIQIYNIRSHHNHSITEDSDLQSFFCTKLIGCKQLKKEEKILKRMLQDFQKILKKCSFITGSNYQVANK